MMRMRYVMTILLLLVAIMFTSCTRQPANGISEKGIKDTPEEAIIYYYLTQKDDQDASKNLSLMDMYPYKGKILVFYRYKGQYIFQWVESKNDGFVAQFGRAATSSSADADYPINIVGTSVASEADAYSAAGIYVKSLEVNRVTLVFSNREIINKYITEGRGFLVFFGECVELNQAVAYDKNNNEIWSSSSLDIF